MRSGFDRSGWDEDSAIARVMSHCESDGERARAEAVGIMIRSAVAEHGTPVYSFDPLTIVAIMQAITMLVQWVQACRKERNARELHRRIRRMSLLDRWRLSAKLKETLLPSQYELLGGGSGAWRRIKAISDHVDGHRIIGKIWSDAIRNRGA